MSFPWTRESRTTMATEKQTPIDRLNYSGDLSLVVDRLCDAYGVGKPTSFSIIEVGYEDCNVTIQTAGGKYVAKIFSKVRSQDDIVRYGAIIEKAVEAGVNHTPLIKTADGEIVYSDSRANGISMILMKFIEGKTFFDIDRAPDAEERQAVIEQAVKINKINYHPSYYFDSWAIPHIKEIFERVKQFIQPDDLKLVEQVIKLYEEVPVETLPHCFVHGDFTKSNVLKGDDGKIYILDFSVANWYPRIEELAVITANLLHDESNPMSLRDKAELVWDQYNKLSPLTAGERTYLYPYALAGVAMEFMGSHQEKYIKLNATAETEYWISLGRNGLQKELGK